MLIAGSPCGNGNVGEDAIVDVLIRRLLKRTSAEKIKLVSRDFARTRDMWPVRNVGAFQKRYVRAFFGADFFIFSGSTMLSEAPDYSLRLLRMAKRYRKRTIVMAAGVNDFGDEAVRREMAQACEWADVITTRDAQSAERLRAMGVSRTPIFATADPAVSFDSYRTSDADELFTEFGVATDKPLIGIGLCYEAGYRDVEQMLPDLDMLASALDAICEKGFGIVFIPSVINPGRDAWVHIRVRNRMRAAGSVSLLHHWLTPAQLTAAMSRLELFIGSRLHELILAVVAGTPVIGLARQEKIKSFVARIGDDDPLLPASMTRVGFLGRVEAALGGSVQRRSDIAKGLGQMREAERFNETVLDAFLGGTRSYAGLAGADAQS